MAVERTASADGNALRSFKEAYLDWFRFWEERDAKGVTSGATGGPEVADLTESVINRDTTRDNLIGLLRLL